MKAWFSKAHGKWRIIVPVAITGTGKRKLLFFDSKTEADAEARKIRQSGLDPAKDISDDQIALLKLLEKECGSNAAEIFRMVQIGKKHSGAVPEEKRLTLEAVCDAYMDAHEHEHHVKTKAKYRSTLNGLCGALDGRRLPMVELTEGLINDVYLKKFDPPKYKPGTKLAQYRNVHAFVTWAFEESYLAVKPLEKSKPPGKFSAQKGILKVEDFRRILAACEADSQFHRLIPYFVLGGLAGMRRCELISAQGAENDPRLEWRDILWDKDKIKVRQEVAKETRAEDRRRNIPLEPCAKAWLQMVAQSDGPIMEISESTLQREKAKVLATLKLKVPENALRNSYASYGAAFRSLGDVARAMGDIEWTVKRHYVDLVDDAAEGRAWFDSWPGADRKIISMNAA
jgi:integrase